MLFPIRCVYLQNGDAGVCICKTCCSQSGVCICKPLPETCCSQSGVCICEPLRETCCSQSGVCICKPLRETCCSQSGVCICKPLRETCCSQSGVCICKPLHVFSHVTCTCVTDPSFSNVSTPHPLFKADCTCASSFFYAYSFHVSRGFL